MAKSSKDQIEQDENKLLTELTKNSKQNIDTIAQNCGFSRQKVWRMMSQLEKNKKIWGYSAVIDSEMQRRQKFILYFKQSTKVHDKEFSEKINLDEINKKLLELGIVIESSYFLHGEYDWIIIFTATDLKQAKKFTDLLQHIYPGLIEKQNLSQVLYIPREHNILNPQSRKLKNIL